MLLQKLYQPTVYGHASAGKKCIKFNSDAKLTIQTLNLLQAALLC